MMTVTQICYFVYRLLSSGIALELMTRLLRLLRLFTLDLCLPSFIFLLSLLSPDPLLELPCCTGVEFLGRNLHCRSVCVLPKGISWTLAARPQTSAQHLLMTTLRSCALLPSFANATKFLFANLEEEAFAKRSHLSRPHESQQILKSNFLYT